MRALVTWFVGTTYVLAALAGAVAVVWAADYEDNSVDPTHWAVGAAVVLAPVGLYGVWLAVGPRIRAWVEESQRTFVAGATAVAAGAVVLIVGAQAVVADAIACGDDDFIDLRNRRQR